MGGFPLQKAGLAGSPPSAIAGVQPTQYRDHRILTYTPPVAEQRFLLRHIVKLDELAGHNAYAEATPDVVDAILEGAGQFAAGEFAPLNRIGDQVGSKWSDGRVITPRSEEHTSELQSLLRTSNAVF